jgi:hypothetical protein
LPEELYQRNQWGLTASGCLGRWQAQVQTQTDKKETDKLKKERKKIANVINYVKDNV